MMVVGLMPKICHEHFEADKLKIIVYNFLLFIYKYIFETMTRYACRKLGMLILFDGFLLY